MDNDNIIKRDIQEAGSESGISSSSERGKIEAEIRMKAFVVCPFCKKNEICIDHLKAGAHFGPWYCERCGRSYFGVRTKTGAVLKPREGIKREVPVLLQYIHDHRLKLVVPGLILSDLREGDEDNGFDYFYNEHTCPSNLLRSGDLVDAEVILDDDWDPHGVFEFVKVLNPEELKIRKSFGV